MARRADNFEMIEPKPIPVIFVSGVIVTMENSHIIFTGWVNIPETEQRRVDVRIALADEAGRNVMAQLGVGFAKGDGRHR